MKTPRSPDDKQDELHLDRLDPFFFPSETTVRFALLVVFLIVFVLANLSQIRFDLAFLSGEINWVNLLQFSFFGILLAFFPAALLWHFLEPRWVLKNGSFTPLKEVDAGLASRATAWAFEMGNLKRVRFWADVADPSLNAQAFGTVLNPNVVLTRGALEFFQAHPGSDEVVLRHEISHQVSGDNQKVSISQKLTALFPVLVVIQLVTLGTLLLTFSSRYSFDTYLSIGSASIDFSQRTVSILGILVNLVAGILVTAGLHAWVFSIQRARELYAYRRAAVFAGTRKTWQVFKLWTLIAETRARAVKTGLGFSAKGKKSLFRDHPLLAEVHAHLDSTFEFFMPQPGLILASTLIGLLIWTAVSSALYQAPEVVGAFTVDQLQATDLLTTIGLGIVMVLIPFMAIMTISGIEYLPLFRLPGRLWKALGNSFLLTLPVIFFFTPVASFLREMMRGRLDILGFMNHLVINQSDIGMGLSFAAFIVAVFLFDIATAKSIFPLGITASDLRVRRWSLTLGPRLLLGFLVTYIYSLFYLTNYGPPLNRTAVLLSAGILLCIICLILAWSWKSNYKCPNCGGNVNIDQIPSLLQRLTQFRRSFRQHDSCESCGFVLVRLLELPKTTSENDLQYLAWHGLIHLPEDLKARGKNALPGFKAITLITLTLLVILSLGLPFFVMNIRYLVTLAQLANGNIDEAAQTVRQIWAYDGQFRDIPEIVSSHPELKQKIWSQFGSTWSDSSTFQLVYQSRPNVDGSTYLWELPDRRVLVEGSTSSLVVWNLATNSLEATLLPNQDFYLQVAINQDGLTVAAIVDGVEIWIWDLQNPGQPIRIKDMGMGFNGLAFSPDGLTLVIGNYPNELIVFDPVTGAILRRWDVHEGTLHDPFHPGWTFAYSPNGDVLATSYDITGIELYDYSNGKFLGEIHPPYQNEYTLVTTLQFSPSGEMILTSGEFGTGITFWDAKTFNLVSEIPIPDAIVYGTVTWEYENDLVKFVDQTGETSYANLYKIAPEVQFISQREIPGFSPLELTGDLWIIPTYDYSQIQLYDLNQAKIISTFELPSSGGSSDLFIDQMAFNGEDLLILYNGELAVFRPAVTPDK
jgi:WD40 repeat protein